MVDVREWAKPAGILGLVTAASLLIYIYYPLVVDFLNEAPASLRDASLFLLGFFGAASVIVPVPYTAFIFTLSSVYQGLNAVETAVFVGVGSGLGEVTGWIVGRSVESVLKTYRSPGYSAALTVIEDRARRSKLLVPLLVFIFALTPLPDDLIFIALGTLRYPLRIALPSSMAGKIIMIYLLVEMGKILGWATGGIGPGMSITVALVVIAAFYILLELVANKMGSFGGRVNIPLERNRIHDRRSHKADGPRR